MAAGVIKVYRRRNKLGIKTKLWGWKLIAANGNTIAGDGGQGYFEKEEARRMASRVVGGMYADATWDIEDGRSNR